MPYTQGVSLTMGKGRRDSPVFSPLPMPPTSLVSTRLPPLGHVWKSLLLARTLPQGEFF